MRGFDLEPLRTLVAVVDAGSLTAAAPKVFLSQSAVSEQIRKLEDQVGQPLLVRSKRGVTPTAAGDRLLSHARRILAVSDEAYRDMRGMVLEGELHLAMTDYFRPAEVAQLLRRLNQAYPRVRLHVAIMKSGEIERSYERGIFDVGVSMRIRGSRGPAIAGGRKGAVLRTEHLAWLGAEGARITRGDVVPLVVLPDTCALHQYTVALLTRRKIPYTVAHVASGVAGLQLALAAGLGVACMNESVQTPDVRVLQEARVLPALPQVQFYVLPARAGESTFVTRAREVMVSHFS